MPPTAALAQQGFNRIKLLEEAMRKRLMKVRLKSLAGSDILFDAFFFGRIPAIDELALSHLTNTRPYSCGKCAGHLCK